MMKLSLRTVRTSHSALLFGDDGFSRLGKALAEERRGKRNVFVLADTNTEKHCIPVFSAKLPGFVPDGIIAIPAGEEHKTLQTAATVWQELTALGADRHSLLVNLGGGVVTDLGGFAASCFKRGIRFIHVPTTLIGMADAAIGGKTGVDLEDLKNQVGTVTLPEMAVIHPVFLETLDRPHLLSGLAELAKTALIADKPFWKMLTSLDIPAILSKPVEDTFLKNAVRRSAYVKTRIVRTDLYERGPRKLLNFGHTAGHALESLMLRRGTPVTHGEAVAMGMICEAQLSVAMAGLTDADLAALAGWLDTGFPRHRLSSEDMIELMGLMLHDKKNSGGMIRFTGLETIGKGKTDIAVTEDQFVPAFRYYNGEL